jgi:hypothetical protein
MYREPKLPSRLSQAARDFVMAALVKVRDPAVVRLCASCSMGQHKPCLQQVLQTPG